MFPIGWLMVFLLWGFFMVVFKPEKKIIPVEGRSLVPIFEGQQRKPHATLAWYWSGNRAIRQGDWKLVWDRTVKRWELYDLSVDRSETNDLAEAHPDRSKRMAETWTGWAKRTNVSLPRRKNRS